MSSKEKHVYIYKESRVEMFHFKRTCGGSAESASGKFASYLNLRKQQRFCAIQLGAHKDLIKYLVDFDVVTM